MGTSEHITVAVIDDDESLCRSLVRLLRANGFETRAHASAEDFLATGTGGCDCLVLDIQLDAMSGVELGEHLAATGSRIPVIFLTANDDPATKARALASGCAGFFRKTEPGDRLVESIRRAVATHLHSHPDRQ